MVAVNARVVMRDRMNDTVRVAVNARALIDAIGVDLPNSSRSE